MLINYSAYSSLYFKSFSLFYFSDQLVFAQGAAATPVELLRGMTELGKQKNVCNVRLFHMHLEGEAPFASKEVESKYIMKKFIYII